MTSPVAPLPNETPEQRQARLDAAYRAHAEIMARQRAAEQARGTPMPVGIPMPVARPVEPVGIPMPVARPADPGFDINIATNTFYKALGDRVKSGQMTLDQARAAQAEMRALQLNPAAANRQAATEIAQRHLQVGPYSPANVAAQKAAQQPQGGLTQAAPYDAAAAYRQNAQKLAEAVKAGQISVQRAQQLQAPLFAAVKMGSTPEGQAAMNAAAAQAQGGMPMTGYDPALQYRNFSQVLLDNVRNGRLTMEQANALKAPVFEATKLGNTTEGYNQAQKAMIAAQQHFMPAQPQEIMVTPYQPMPEIVTPPPSPAYYDPGGPVMPPPPMPVMPPPPVVYDTFRPETPPPAQGGGIGAFLGRQGEAPQAGGMLPRLAEMLNPQPRQPTGVNNTTFIAGDPNFRFGETPQVKAPNAQGMAMGGLLRKYYGGGMC